MGSSTAFPSPLFIPSFLPRRHSSSLSFFAPPISFPRPSNPPILRIPASLLHSDVAISWFPPDPNSLANDYGGWTLVQHPPTPKTKKKGFKLQFRSPLNTIHGVFSLRETKDDETEARDYTESDEHAAEELTDYVPLAITKTAPSAPTHKLEHIVVHVAVDSTQQEALMVLKKLKIIEDDVRAEELCTRREYARWLVRTSSLLERNPKHMIVPSVTLSGSETAAYDDVGADDPDYKSIQALAEAGIIPRKLSDRTTASDGSKGGINFFPDRFISREDLINWKALVEYDFEPGVIEQSRYQGQR